ncbi:MAG: hypothetical protein IPL49_18465 [Saprospirales bacterium]|nr:hypothetical protein [Saprospirales bacterium]MBK8492806.1 hypothetical protein [Saprospirales bacterium]
MSTTLIIAFLVDRPSNVDILCQFFLQDDSFPRIDLIVVSTKCSISDDHIANASDKFVCIGGRP